MEKFEQREKPIVIGEANVEDAEGIGRVHAETWLATYPNEEHGITREDVKARVAERLPNSAEHWRAVIEDESGNRRVLVAKEDGHVVGFCSAEKKPDENKISAIYILPDAQKKGIGQKLWDEASQWLGSDAPVSLSVAAHNANAIAFYKKIGFKEVGALPQSEFPKMPSGKTIPLIKMIKSAVGSD